MNQEIKTRWVEALRSEKYEQTFYKLKDFNKENCYCALGVLIHLGEEEGLKAEDPMYDFYSGVSLPKEIRKWADVDENPSLDPEEDEMKVITLNDAKKLTFLEIADLIEKSPL